MTNTTQTTVATDNPSSSELDKSAPENLILEEKPALDCSRPGELLRQAREAKGLTQLEVAKKLNFLPIYIPSLEDENFAPLHNPTFIKGYLRAYARFLGINAEEVLHCFASHYPELAIQEPAPVEIMKPEKVKNKWAFKLFSLLVFLGIVAIMVFWWLSRSPENVTSLATEQVIVETKDGTQTLGASEAATPVTSLENAEQPATAKDTSEENLETTAAAQAENSSQPAASSKPESGAKPESSSKPKVPAVNTDSTAQTANKTTRTANAFSGNLQKATLTDVPNLGVAFTSECWVEIRDADNKLLHSDLMQNKQQILVEGKAPYSIIFGNGRAAKVFYQGAEYDFSQRIRPNGYTSLTLE